MSLLDESYRRHLILKTLAAEESVRPLTDASASRHIEFGIVQVDDEYSTAKQKIELFYEELGRRIDEMGFLDQFVAFERLLESHRKKTRTKRPRVPEAKKLAQYLRPINRGLADDYELLKLERNAIAHGLLTKRPLIASIAYEKQILESVLDSLE